VPLVLARIERPVRRDPVDRDQRAVHHDVGVSGLPRVPDRLTQFRRPGREQAHRLADVSPGSRDTDREPGRELGECLAFTQVGEHEQSLLPGVQLPPGRADRAAVTADEAGHEGQGPGRQRQRGTVEKQLEPLAAMKVVLVDCLIYRGLPRCQRCHAAASPDRDEPITTRMKRAQ
jgi:hypothetical protein